MLEVTLKGVREVATLIKQLSDDIESNIELNQELSQTLSQKASSMAPKLTGELASSVKGNASGQKAQVMAGSAAVPYAGVIEYGWPDKNIQAQPYLRPAVYNNIGFIVEKYNDSIKSNIKKYDLD